MMFFEGKNASYTAGSMNDLYAVPLKGRTMLFESFPMAGIFEMHRFSIHPSTKSILRYSVQHYRYCILYYEFRWTNRTDERRSGVLVFGTNISSSVKVPNCREGGGGDVCFDLDDDIDDQGATPMTVHGLG
jgi:hypothetical protein